MNEPRFEVTCAYDDCGYSFYLRRPGHLGMGLTPRPGDYTAMCADCNRIQDVYVILESKLGDVYPTPTKMWLQKLGTPPQEPGGTPRLRLHETKQEGRTMIEEHPLNEMYEELVSRMLAKEKLFKISLVDPDTDAKETREGFILKIARTEDGDQIAVWMEGYLNPVIIYLKDGAIGMTFDYNLNLKDLPDEEHHGGN